MLEPRLQPLVSVRVLGFLLDAYERCGHDRKPLESFCESSGVDLGRTEDRVSPDLYRRFWECLRTSSGDDAIGVHVGAAVPHGAREISDFILRSASTFADMLPLASKFSKLLDATVIPWEQETGSLTLWASDVMLGVTLDRAQADYRTVRLVSTVRALIGKRLTPIEAHFTRPAPADPTPHQAYLGCVCLFDRPVNGVVVPTSWNEITLPSPDAALAKMLIERAEEDLARLPSHTSFTEQTLDAIRLFLGDSRVPSMDQVAARLAVSPRSLRRRLADESNSFAQLVAICRRRVAEALLADSTVTLDEVATAAGFMSTSAFHRAFRNWTGTTPREYRAGRQAGAAADGDEERESDHKDAGLELRSKGA